MLVTDSDLFLSLPRRASAPATRTEDHLTDERKGNLRRTWKEFIGPVTDGDDDFEEFYEEAARLDAAVYAFLPRRVWMSEYQTRTARNLGTGEVVPLDQVWHLRRYGGQPSIRDTGVPELVSERDIERYDRFQAFTRNAGRPLILAGYDLDGRAGVELLDAVRMIAAQGFRKVVVKATRAKYGIATITVPDDATDEGIVNDLYEQLEWAMMSMGGKPEAFLVQGHAPMRFEYRVFVVNGRPVTGAACLVDMTPANHRWDSFDKRIREHRFDKSSPVVDDEETVRRLVGFAAQVAKQWQEERPDLGTAVIDVALDDAGRPLVVEFNGLLNSGLYASDPRAVTVALAADQRLPEVYEPVVPSDVTRVALI